MAPVTFYIARIFRNVDGKAWQRDHRFICLEDLFAWVHERYSDTPFEVAGRAGRSTDEVSYMYYFFTVK